ncbi:hypothetical protein M9H77_04215 [Catharanthus roseus]|uniref:Uncharacterized protein n=1 Tax=Catharanthus roseus TaxID=4058 RepID=A0ACC0CDE7_CATRO|nr:hypothetical protein M9H77_04215 [Catharanthus roseus]
MAGELDKGTKKRKTSYIKSNSRNAVKRNKNLKKNHTVVENFGVRKMDRKMKKMLQKKARDYNSDDDEDNGEEVGNSGGEESSDNDEAGEENIDEGNQDSEEVSADDDSEVQPGTMRFSDGCKSFQMAFKKITKTATTDDALGPVLSAHKKLVIEKLAEEEAERKVKGEAKKEKRLLGEKGHVKPADYLDSHEKSLIGIATRGVVKLFNAVNKAQHVQKGLNPSRSKEEKAIKKRRKEAFFSQLSKTSSQTAGTNGKAVASASHEDGDGPEWAPLRDNYMLTKSKLKDWDRMPETTDGDDFGMPQDTHTSSDED